MVDCNVGESAAPGPDTTALLEDWITIWQSEMAGLVLDRELHEALLRWVDSWAAQARAVLAMAPPLDADRASGPVPPPRPTTAPASPDNASVARLQQRIAELERRLADLESARG